MTTSHKNESPKILIVHGLLSILYSMLFFIASVLIAFLALNIWYAGRILPGVFIDDIPLGGYSQQEAQELLRIEFLPDIPQTITFTFDEQSWTTTSLELGIQYDTDSIAREAFSIGRRGPFAVWGGNMVALLSGNKVLPTTIGFDEASAVSALNEIAQEIDQPLLEASVSFNGETVTTTRGQIGREVKINESLAQVTQALQNNTYTSIELVVHEEQPAILDAEPYAQLIREYLQADFTLIAPTAYQFTETQHPIQAANLGSMLYLIKDDSDGQFSINLQFKEAVLEKLLSDLSEQLLVKTENPRFIFNDESGEIELSANGITGRTLNIGESMAAIQSEIEKGAHHATLVFDYHTPAVADGASGEELGITELVHSESTYFYGSDKARIQNITTAANRFLGLLVAPGETFSMADAMGEISLDTGFTEALIIYNGKTIDGVGGGVCQVSTTLFRAAFFAGFPIIERHPHAYRVSYYEKAAGNYRDPNLAGLDATVYIPLVDLKFQNDTPYWLLMEAYVYPGSSQIQWKFYSTSDGRSVEWETTGPVNKVEPPKPKYYLNTSLDEGEIKQVDWEAEGSDVRVDRWVYKAGVLHLQDQFFTHYEPWGAIYEIGPGVDGYPISEE